MFRAPFVLLSVLGLVPAALAANADQWRGRSIYQIITDRYALPSGSPIDPHACNTSAQTWCGGTWAGITQNLDYIQAAGFTAIWISPVSQNYVGPRTPYGDPYHGYWVQDASQLNARFGSADDLKALVAAVHQRGMYIMVDVVVNNVMALGTTPDYSQYMFKDAADYHPYCPVDYSNRTSEMECWLGDSKVSLPDLNTESATVQSGYQAWIKDLVQTYGIDGLRIDAAKHVQASFWQPFCVAAGVFCMGEVFGDDVGLAAQYASPAALDSILNYPLYDALVAAFAIPGPANVSALQAVLAATQAQIADPTVLGNFLENQDNPRWANMSVDVQSMYNAMTYTFMSDGIPIVYYGQEQRFHGGGDPGNREPLWPSQYNKTTDAYVLIQKLNTLRNHLVNTTDWATERTTLLATAATGIAIMKGNVVSMLTTVGSPPQAVTLQTFVPWATSTPTTDVLTCTQYAVGAGGTINVGYSQGGRPVVLVPNADLYGSGICTAQVNESMGKVASASGGGKNAAAVGHTLRPSLAVAAAGLTAAWTWGWS